MGPDGRHDRTGAPLDSFTLDKIEFDAVRRILAEFCSCSLGKALAVRIGPSRSPEIIDRWLRQTREMVRALRDAGPPPFGGITDIYEPLQRAIPGGGAEGEDFARIAGTLTGALNLRNYFSRLDEGLGELHAMAGDIGIFTGEIKAIEAVVAADGSVHDYASTRLSTIRREIQSTADRIHEVIYGYLRDPEVARLLQNATVTLHGDRYVLPIKSENRGRLKGVVHRASNTGATVFVEPSASVELNNRLADLAEDERREIQRLFNELSMRIHARMDEIVSTMRTVGQIDLVSAKAHYAYQFEMTCPEMAERGELLLHQARHPLLIDQSWRQERAGVPAEKRHAVVPIDVRLGSDFDVLIITGSNTGGKTVALKTVALLAVMAQSGMLVPVQRGSRLPVFRDIFIDIGDEQSLEQSLSTFGGHVRRLQHILRKADKSCLVLLDELGSGTDPDEGGAIGQSILDELRSIGCLAMVTTHLSVLKAYAFNHERVDNGSVEFDTASLRPTYKLLIGTPGESHAITVAQHLGMPKRITGAAKRYLGSQGAQFRRAIKATTVARESAEEAKAQARVAELAAVSQAEVYESKLADLHRLKEEFETWLARLGELRPGDMVPVPALNKSGRLVRLELHRQVALVDADGKQVEVSLRDLMPDLGQEQVRKEIAELRRQIMTEAAEAEKARAEATRLHEEYSRSLEMQKQRARQFDAWLGAIARVKVGDEVPVAIRPGRGKVVSVDLPGLRATIETKDGEKTVSLQDLFPQTGPFARPPRPRRGEGPDGSARGQGEPRQRRKGRDKTAQQQRKPKGPPPDRPIRHVEPDSKAARANTQAVAKLQPGDAVFVIPFNKRATLIRVDVEKGQAVVQSGIFELDLPLADVEPIREAAPPPKKAKGPKPDRRPEPATPGADSK